jgi:Mg-chelatase subunit ChlD
MIRFGTPLMLLALLALPLMPYLVRGRRARAPLIALRVVVVALLILSAAGMEIARTVPDLTVVLAADRSDSIGPDAQRQLRAFLDEVRQESSSARRVGLVTFGANAILEESPNEKPRLAAISRPRTDGTNLAAAITTSLAAMPDGAGRRIVMLTDGQSNAGELGPALLAARARDVELTVVPVATDPPPDAMVDEVTMPPRVAVGERLPVTVTLRATTAAEAHLRVRANGALLLARDLRLRAGITRIDLEPVATDPGLLRIDASIDPTPDGETANNRAFALGFVTGPPFVFYAGATAGPLARALETQGLKVRRVLPAQLPASTAGYQGASAVILDDVPAFALSQQQQIALRDYVRIGGGGVIAVGGTQSFGIGGYAGTPLEELLPVSMDVRHRLAVPSMAIVLVLDASGSMGSFGSELAKVELAKETAQSVVDLLGERDLIGVLAFDQVPRWLVRPTPASERVRILDAVSRIKAGGGTVMYPALESARDALRQVEAKVKHVIVLSDGQTDPGAFQNLVTGMAADRITVSTVAIGRDADLDIMKNIASWGRGRSYVTKDLYSIPQILTAEALLATRAYVIEERFTPRVVGNPSVLADVGALPPLRGYLATAPKPSADVPVISLQDDPLVAMWSYGLGRAIAVTTDAQFRWTAEWSGWSRAARFWSQLARWVGTRDTDTLDVHAETTPQQVRIVLDARAPDGRPLVSLDAAASVSGSSGDAGTARLVQTRAGWYEGSVPLPAAGAYLIHVTASEGGRPYGRAALPLAVPYSPELRQVGLNRAVISQLVEVGGAKIIGSVAEALAPPSNPVRRSQPVWPWFSGLALAGLMAEVAMRRIPALEDQMRRLGAAVGAFIRREPTPVQVEQDQEYEAADRWRIEEPTEAAARAASMDAAARLYIARLRRSHGQDDPPDGGGHG